MTDIVYRNAREAIAANLWTPEEIERERAAWPALGDFPKWAHDPDVGLVERSYTIPGGGLPRRTDEAGRLRSFPLAGGQDGSAVVGTFGEDGARARVTGGTGIPRINSYGDSFTHGEQVNDAETWQEYLAGHLLEPIRNFGLSGGSVYQTYLRMIREESGPNGGDYVLFYIWGNDHLRSIRGWAFNLLICRQMGLAIGNPTIGWDPDPGSLIERPTWLPDPDSLARLGDPDWLARFADDTVTQLFLFAGSPFYSTDSEQRERLRQLLDPIRVEQIDHVAAAQLAAYVGLDWSGTAQDAHDVLDAFSLRASIHVIEKARQFAELNGKQIMFLLLDPFRGVPELLDRGTRYDQPIVDHLQATGARYFDMTRFHVDEMQSHREGYEQYFRRYFVDAGGHYSPSSNHFGGHYNAAGNHFFAFALKPHLVEWLDPKPAPYRAD